MSIDGFRRAVVPSAIPWRVVWIVASALLNVLLIGVIAGHLFTSRRDPRLGMLVPGAHVRALPVEERHRFLAAMAGHRETIHAARLAQRRARLAAETDIGAPTLDADKVRADFKALREANGALQAAVNDGLVEALESLSPSSRAALVSRKGP